MICKKCGKPLPNEGAICKFCGAMMSQEQMAYMRRMNDSKQRFQTNLLSDRYGVNKQNLYKETETPKENKALGAAIILIILLFLIILVILVNR